MTEEKPLTNLAQMTNNKPNTKAVEVNGIRFEIRLNNSVIPLPPREEEEEVPGEEEDIFAKDDDDDTPGIEFEIIITNNTSETFYFAFHNNLIPKLIASDGQIFDGGHVTDWMRLPIESDFLLSRPGETLTFTQPIFLYHTGDDFRLSFNVLEGGAWTVSEINNPGTYKLQFTYKSVASVIKVDTEEGTRKKIENIWMGEVDLPTLELQLVDESI
ncbi:MAG: hypothetical protein SWX82_06900 [Cyanobacteriota bacterium]|nr:hypothetical protein [Cyanobacteriota bacterium]